MARVTGPQAIRRRLNLADLAVLVLAMAVGLVMIRRDLEALFSMPRDLQGGQWVYRWTLPVALSKAVTVEVWLMAWTAGWLTLQLRPPRLRLHQLSRQPGFVACFSSVIITLGSGPLTWAILRSNASGANDWLDRMVWAELVSSQVGAAVHAGWALLLASGRCRIRAGWLDRVGQVMGLIWVAMIPANLAHCAEAGVPFQIPMGLGVGVLIGAIAGGLIVLARRRPRLASGIALGLLVAGAAGPARPILFDLVVVWGMVARRVLGGWPVSLEHVWATAASFGAVTGALVACLAIRAARGHRAGDASRAAGAGARRDPERGDRYPWLSVPPDPPEPE